MREVQFDRLGQARVFQRSLQSKTKKGTGQLSQSLHSIRVLNSTRLYFSDITSLFVDFNEDVETVNFMSISKFTINISYWILVKIIQYFQFSTK